MLAAIVGAAGLAPTLAAARAGKRILLANKEALVIGGAVFMAAVSEGGATLLPIDSEHNAIFQCLPPGYDRRPDAAGVRRILLTASGGPFRSRDPAELPGVSPAEACAHPNWSMGRKISVDSATMMNKGLEVIEAHWLFGVSPDRIEVVIHPQSVIHSLVEYVDGSVLAQLGHPDMRTPIAQALAYPARIDAGVPPLDLIARAGLDFSAPDAARFPCLGLAYAALAAGGTAPAVLNAANEVAVAAFLDGRARFTEIAVRLRRRAGAHPGRAGAHARRRPGGRCIGPRRRARLPPPSRQRLTRPPMDLATKVLSFLFVLAVLVVIHELGHYLVARWCGVKIIRFSVGFGRVVWSRRLGRDQTEWALSAVPLGGYVKMADEREGDVAPGDLARAFNRQSVWKRVAIVAAGPVANLLLAVALFAGTFVAGIAGTEGAAGAAAGRLGRGGRPGSRPAMLVVAVDGVPVSSWQDLRWRLLKASGRDDAAVEVERQGGSAATRLLPLSGLAATDWEGPFISALGLKLDSGPPLIDQVVAGKPAARAGLLAGDRIVAIDDTPVRSPADVAAKTNGAAGPRTRVPGRARRRGARGSAGDRDRRARRQAPGHRRRAAQGRSGIGRGTRGHRPLRRRRRDRAGRAQDLGTVGLHGEDARPHAGRRRRR